MARDVQAARDARERAKQERERAAASRQRVRKAISTRVESEEYAPYVSTIKDVRHPCFSDPVGRERYTPQRFMSDCCDETYKMLVDAWCEGSQLVARRVPVDGLPCVLIMASYLRGFDIDLVDDFDALVFRYDEHITECAHPDKFFASCISILHRRYLRPGDEAFEMVRVPSIYEEMF